jgi:hypothetical protein
MSIMLPALKALVRQDASRNTCSRTMIRLGWRSGARQAEVYLTHGALACYNMACHQEILEDQVTLAAIEGRAALATRNLPFRRFRICFGANQFVVRFAVRTAERLRM